MNIQRYKWPVIVAAGLHGALLLINPHDPRTPHDPKTKPEPPVNSPPIEQIEMREPEVTSGDGATGAVEKLSSLEDVPPPQSLHETFVMPPTEAYKSARDVVKLPEMGRILGDGKGLPGIGAPTMPTNLDLDRVPRAVVQVSPDYPHSLRQAGVAGSVTIEFVVGTDGQVISANAVRWTHRELAESAVRAVLRWKFEPGTIEGRKVRFRMAVPIEFNANS